MPDFSNMRLGKQAAFFHPRTPKLANLIHMSGPALPPAPTEVDYTSRVHSWPMFDNDRLGDCTVAAVGHLIQLYTSYTKPAPIVMTDTEIVETYSAVSGYVPNDPSTDNGAIEQNVLNYWMHHGIPVPDGRMDHISGYARVNPINPTELKYAVWWFGGLYIGLNMPAAWQSASEWFMPANTVGPNAPGTWGGHAVPIVAYNPEFLTVISWGEKIKLDWKAYHTYCDESWAVLDADFINQQGVTPAHFDWTYLLSGMQHIREGIV